ncbi:hypothetical protein FX016_18295 [Cupriavidus gilardii]|nr:hypothetical protein FX016_18295 [Cupriavidus gilardii]
MEQTLCSIDWALVATTFTDIFKALWSWQSLVAILAFTYRKELRLLLQRALVAKRFGLGPISWQSDEGAAELTAQEPKFGETRTVQYKVFVNQIVPLDGIRYVGCKFVNCILLFEGTGTSIFQDVSLEGHTEWRLGKYASNTVHFLASIYKGAAAEGVEHLIARIRSGDQAWTHAQNPTPATPPSSSGA